MKLRFDRVYSLEPNLNSFEFNWALNYEPKRIWLSQLVDIIISILFLLYLLIISKCVCGIEGKREAQSSLFGKTKGHQPVGFGMWGSPPSHVWCGGERGGATPLLIWIETLLWGITSWHPNYLTCIPGRLLYMFKGADHISFISNFN